MLSNKPNIILINCDDLGYGDIGCYGSEVNRTPTLDYMAENGMKFTDFYMVSPLCSPSRGGMMTGCYPRRIGFGSFEGRCVLFPGQAVGLSQDETTVASILKEQGYSTMLVGKWHCGDQPEFLPTRHGFDHYYGLPYSNDMGRQAGLKKQYPPLPLLMDEEVIQEQPDQTSITERYTEQAVRFIRGNKENPFFLYFAHMHVHLPIYAPDRFLKKSKNGRYGAAVECIDWSISVILDELRENGILDNTLVVFTSDNGSRARGEGGSNSPLRGYKTQTWEGGMRLPCIMYWPGKIPAGKKCSEIISSIDFLPTFSSLAGGNVPDDRIIDGKDITGLMFGENDSTPPHETFFYYSGDTLEAVRKGKWKLHVYKTDREIRELYNLENDISETENLYKKRPEIVEDLMNEIEKCREDLGDKATGNPGKNTRPIGRVENARPLTEYDTKHPYIISMYDLEEKG